MKYRPSLPAHNVNVSHHKPLREFLVMLAALSAVALLLYWALGAVVDHVVDHLTPATEARLHRALAPGTDQAKAFDPPRQMQLQRMVDSLRPCSGLPYPVTLELVQSEQPNATVQPGAHIVVFSGLLDRIRSENGLAFVLAHEMSHLRHRDHLRGLGRSVILVTLSTVLTGAQSDITQILAPASRFGLTRHTRQRETEADSGALDILHCHYGHVSGATEFFDTLLQDKDNKPSGLSHHFASHPDLRTRIDNLERQMRARGYAHGRTIPLDLAAAGSSDR